MSDREAKLRELAEDERREHRIARGECPYCGSPDVEAVPTGAESVHVCNECGRGW